PIQPTEKETLMLVVVSSPPSACQYPIQARTIKELKLLKERIQSLEN
ncbi:9248_t:CDS:1, partial [Gigaspora margarita]